MRKVGPKYMILIVEDERAHQTQLKKWIARACRMLAVDFDPGTQVQLGLREGDIDECVEKCRAANSPLILILDPQIDFAGQGPTTVDMATKRLWQDRNVYVSNVPIIVYTGGFSMDSLQSSAPRAHGWVVPKNPPNGKSTADLPMAAILDAIQAAVQTWGTL